MPENWSLKFRLVRFGKLRCEFEYLSRPICQKLKSPKFLQLLIYLNFLKMRFMQRTYLTRISIFLKMAQTRYTGGFWDGESRGTKIFLIRWLLTLTGPLLKIGGFWLIFLTTTSGRITGCLDTWMIRPSPLWQKNIHKNNF